MHARRLPEASAARQQFLEKLMAVPKVVGIEQEYAVALTGNGEFDPVDLSFLVVNAHEKAVEAIWDYDRESPLMDARGFRREGEESVISNRANYRINNLLVNGARLYVDHAHPEYATAECRLASDAVALDKAGERIVRDAATKANEKRGGSGDILILKNNSDHKGNSYGTHENYLMSTEAYQRLFPRYPAYPELTMGVLVPFLVTRQIFAGAGKVGSENGTEKCDYQLSQRADFFETVIGGQTTHTRPIVNTRDEPHADKERYSRLHVIVGDANMSELSGWLKVGATQLVLELIESGLEDLDLSLEDPVRALVEVSHDLTLRRKLRLKKGGDVTAIEIQRCFLERVEDRLLSSGLNPEGAELAARWRRTLDILAEDPMQLGSELDWVIKKRLIERTRGRKGLSWSDARVIQMDFRYHDLRPDHSLYYLLEREGHVERVLTEERIKRFVTQAPEDTRAYFRSRCLRDYRDSISHANWDVLTFDLGDRRECKVPLLDPLKGTRAMVEELFDAAPTAGALLERLSQP